MNALSQDANAESLPTTMTTTMTTPGTMRAILQHQYGTADTLSLEVVERPAIGDREVLIEVRAAGLDRGTWHLMAGVPYAVRPVSGLRAPKQPVPGYDVAGVVVAVGSSVTRFQPNDEVFGIAKGSFAEFAAAREDKLALKPPTLTFVQAAAMPVSGLTALRGLETIAQVELGQHVLVVGASGGVGTHAVQIARALGARVTGVCSASKVELVRSLGADDVLEYTSHDYLMHDSAAGETRYDVILDIGGNSSIGRLRRALTPNGTLVITGGEGAGRWFGVGRQLRAKVISPFVRQRLTSFINKEHYAGLERLSELVADGRLVPSVGATYPLADMPDAMRDLVAGNARGKLVIVP
jgi:NADPH:quinone reductase-like Zn-dependent oxidoreductase